MIVGVAVRRHRHVGTEQAAELVVYDDLQGCAAATHVAVEADDPIGGSHHDMQIVAHHEHAATPSIHDPADQLVQLGLPRVIHSLHGLVQHEQVWHAHERSREEDPLEFATRQVRDPCRKEVPDRSLLKCLCNHLGRVPAGQGHEPSNGERQRRIEMDALRHVADTPRMVTAYGAGIGHEEPEEQSGEGGFSRSVRPDEGYNLAAGDSDIDVVENPSSPPAQSDAAGLDQCFPVQHRLRLRPPWSTPDTFPSPPACEREPRTRTHQRKHGPFASTRLCSVRQLPHIARTRGTPCRAPHPARCTQCMHCGSRYGG